MSSLRVLVLTKYDSKGASSRLRSIQYFREIEKNGIELEHSPLFDDIYLENLYSGEKISAVYVLKRYLKRFLKLFLAKQYDLLWIEKELFPWMPLNIEGLLNFFGVRYIVDYDDAIFHNYDNNPRKIVRFFLKNKIPNVMKNAKLVTVCNGYLKQKALDSGSKNIEIIPTVVDIEKYNTLYDTKNEVLTIGWIGTPSTEKYIIELLPMFEKLSLMLNFKIVIIGGKNFMSGTCKYEILPWSQETESLMIEKIDIGIMPLLDSKWEQGKCGYKLIQYMACGKPVVASSVGMNCEIIEEGLNGFLVKSNDEWMSAIMKLSDLDSRIKLGKYARQKVEKTFSLQSTTDKRIQYIIENVKCKMKKLLRITTVPISLKILLKDQLKFMNQYFEVVGVSSKGKELHGVSDDEGVRTIELNMSREITPAKDFVSLVQMIVLLLKEKPTIVHTHTPKAGVVGMLASWVCRVPYRLHTVAGLPVMEAVGKKKKILLMVEKLTYACATKVYPNSYGLQEYILKNRLTDEKKLKVIGHGSSNGIDTSYFDRVPSVMTQARRIKEEYNLDNKFTFCFVGRVVKDKGIDELLNAFDKLSQEFEDIRLLIVGKLEEDLDPISAHSHTILKVNRYILNVGFQNDIRPYLACSDCFVLPTYREGFPNVVLQASAMGLSSIVTNINGCNEIIQNGENGITIEQKDTEALYRAMKMYLTDNKLVEKLSVTSRHDIIKKYDRKVFYKLILDEYNKVIKDD